MTHTLALIVGGSLTVMTTRWILWRTLRCDECGRKTALLVTRFGGWLPETNCGKHDRGEA